MRLRRVALGGAIVAWPNDVAAVGVNRKYLKLCAGFDWSRPYAQAQSDRPDHAENDARMLTAAATLSLSGPLRLQGRQAARGLELWASTEHITLQIVDDAGSPAKAVAAYREWLGTEIDLLLGPYGSGLARRVGPLASAHGSLLWNHGGSADDLARRLVVAIPAPASTYFVGAVELAFRRGLQEVVLVRGKGRFASAVVAGARQRAGELGMATSEAYLEEWSNVGSLGAAAVLVVGSFAEDLAFVEQLGAQREPGLIGCVGAGLPEFGDRLGSTAEGVVGPVQWIPQKARPEVGPSGAEFARRYEATFGAWPSYVAAQAAAAGFLALEAHRRSYRPGEIHSWETTTLLGPFALDASWRQVGHGVITTRWHNGRQVLAL